MSRSIDDQVRSALRDMQPKRRGNGVTKHDLRRKLEANEYRCVLTGRKLTPDSARLDHVVAFNDGGTNDLSNLQWVHVDVNVAKGTMTQREFVQLCCDVADWWRARQCQFDDETAGMAAGSLEDG